MRCLMFLLVSFPIFSSFSQTGSLIVNCIDEVSNEPISICVDLKIDTAIFYSYCIDSSGRKKFSELPLGLMQLNFTRNGKDLGSRMAFIQENQVFQLPVRINIQGTVSNSSASQYDISKQGGLDIPSSLGKVPVAAQITSLEIKRSSVQDLQMVTCMAYRVPLMSLSDGSSSYKYVSEDIKRMPTRSAVGMARMLGGVRYDEQSGNLNIRGARSDANIYYVDGIRVSNFNSFPKSSMGEVTIYTGGIPAKYGDVTGGVVTLETSRIPYALKSNYSPGPKRVKRQFVEPPVQAVIPTPVFVEPEKVFTVDRFMPIYENDFCSTISNPNSTFSIDVDRASWTYVQNQFKNKGTVARDAVKLEEMVNAFDYKTVKVPENELLHVEIERSDCAWNTATQIVTIHLKAQDLPKEKRRKAHNFVFLIDVSGSMQSYDKTQLLKEGLVEFVQTLDENDRISIVTYAGRSAVVLEPTFCRNKELILTALNGLTSGGSTNGIGGIQMAYELAEQNYDLELNNRIILCTDGDFNVGISNPTELEDYIASKRGGGIYLTALGFGMGNYRNDVLETLADRGDGNHFYINGRRESKRVLIDEIGNLMNVARDVKLNVEFNPKLVKEYRLIGYENRLLKPQDFEDDTKDAGEIGYGHDVTAVYEIVLGKSETEKTSFTKTKATGANGSELAIVKLRYKSFEDKTSVERKYSLSKEDKAEKNDLLNTVISFGLLLRNSSFAGEMTTGQLAQMAIALPANGEDVKVLKEMIGNYTAE
jgi:Ca-activated chloride channel family protein